MKPKKPQPGMPATYEIGTDLHPGEIVSVSPVIFREETTGLLVSFLEGDSGYLVDETGCGRLWLGVAESFRDPCIT